MELTLFLSHIHEEKELAKIIKEAIEDEFSGFVNVFVSSDGISIPVGSNFLKRIEDGLINCIGALYLISPISVKRNWVNFELGAVWIRNTMNLKSGEKEIPTIPVCHSGITPSLLPQPLNNLNAIQANLAPQLEFSFRSLQKAVGGKGNLKTNFDLLKDNVVAFEKKYTIGGNLKIIFSSLGSDIQKLINHCQSLQTGQMTTIQCGFIETNKVQLFKNYESKELQGIISVDVKNPGTTFGPMGSVNGAEVTINISRDIILDNKDVLLA